MSARAAIPYGGYWSTPFARWQGSFQNLHSLLFAAHVARVELARRKIDPASIDFGVLGMTVPQRGSFYGLPWLMGEIGAPRAGGPTVMQACATGARIVSLAASEIERGGAETALVVAADRVSNGPHVYYPAPQAPGGTGETEDWVLANFRRDPFAGVAMVETAENVARKAGISRAEQDELSVLRYEQYGAALAEESAFLKRFMTLPFAVPDHRFMKQVANLSGDEGVYPTSPDKLASLELVMEGGTVTLGGQTHPADGNAGMIVTTRERAAELSADGDIRIALLGFGLARVEPALMPAAPVPATRAALEDAGIAIGDIDIVTSHNPFAVNDLYFAGETGFPLDKMNPYGCSLVWGHPQGPTGLRSIIELIEALAQRGGGHGLFQGCAAGDTAMAVVLRVDG